MTAGLIDTEDGDPGGSTEDECVDNEGDGICVDSDADEGGTGETFNLGLLVLSPTFFVEGE